MWRVRRMSSGSRSVLVPSLRARGFSSQAELLRYLDVFRAPGPPRWEPSLPGFSVVHEAAPEGSEGADPVFCLR